MNRGRPQRGEQVALRPSTDRRGTAKRGSPSYSTEQRETVRSGLRIPARMTSRAHLRRQASPSSAFPPPRKSATVSYGLCNPDPTSVAYINATLSYGTCIPTPERTRKSKCSLFVSLYLGFECVSATSFQLDRGAADRLCHLSWETVLQRGSLYTSRTEHRPVAWAIQARRSCIGRASNLQ